MLAPMVNKALVRTLLGLALVVGASADTCNVTTIWPAANGMQTSPGDYMLAGVGLLALCLCVIVGAKA